MTTYSLTLQEEHLDLLTTKLLHDDHCERAAYLLCNKVPIGRDPWDHQAHRKYLSSKVIPVIDDEIVTADETHVTWKTPGFVNALKEAESKDQVLAVVHCHPSGKTAFSTQDDINESELLQTAVNRNGVGTHILSLLIGADRQLIGRIWLQASPNGQEQLRVIRVIGKNIRLDSPKQKTLRSDPTLHRQALAFGDALNHDLRALRIGIVGGGATGSAVAMLLARLGVGQLLIIDQDIVDRTNLNRLHGAKQSDSDAMRFKANVIADSISTMGLGVRTVPLIAWVGDEKCRDALRSCDIIFGCTDDHDGRLFLNRFAYYYLVPVIDIGLAIEVDEGVPPIVRALDGRVTVVGPRHTCLLCREVINTKMALAESLRRANPEEYERQKAEAYVIGEGNPSPAVVTFTTELACVAINELIHRIQGYRGPEGATDSRLRKFNLMRDIRQGRDPRIGCSICGNDTLWGQGDTEPFLGRVN